MNKTVFVQMYMHWGNTVTYSVKIYNFSVITSTTSFLNIFLYTNLDTFKIQMLNLATPDIQQKYSKLGSVAGRLC